MQGEIKQLVKKYYDATINCIEPLGGGFYGRVFAVDIDKEPFKIVIKLYLFSGLAEKEALQIKTLSKYAKVKMPEIYFVELAKSGYDAVGMSYFSGINAGNLKDIPSASAKQIGREIVDNLIAYHSAINIRGFGQLNSEKFYPDWREYYRPVAIEILHKATKLCRDKKLDRQTYEIMEKAVNLYNEIFYLPITQARLIHGDYNTWNIILTENLQHVNAVIDPFNCCWADSEFDLYQLDNANGKDFNLLTLYSNKVKLSENFEQKRKFYELFTELNHFYDAGIGIEESNIPLQAMKLNNILMEL